MTHNMQILIDHMCYIYFGPNLLNGPGIAVCIFAACMFGLVGHVLLHQKSWHVQCQIPFIKVICQHCGISKCIGISI